MGAFLIYMLKVAVVSAVFFLVYKVCLSRQTFHGFNRAVLLVISVLSFMLPACHVENDVLVNRVRNAIHIPQAGIFRSVAESSPSPVIQPSAVVPAPSASVVGQESDAGSLAPAAHGSLQQSQAQTVADVPSDPVQAEPAGAFGIIPKLLFIIWCIGFLYLAVKKVFTIISIRRIIGEGHYLNRQDECDLIENDRLSQPMNWMSYILMPHAWLEKENKAVWSHETLHARKAHTLDFLLIDVLHLFQWFNPVMFLIYKELELIHEYQADRAVLESGADARSYKLMLVEAVAQSHGYSTASWLKQNNLKKRIDMMQKKESNRWNRLRALFIPLLAVVFLFLNTAMSSAQDQSFSWPFFEDGKTWVYADGTAKVQTYDGVQANMKTEEVPGYLARYKGVKTTRMTLRYMYDIDDLNVVYPLARSLADKGIHISVANNDDMLTEMTMPEYRTPAIYDLGNGQFRFEMNCNLKRNVHMFRYTSDKSYLKVTNPSVTGNLDKVMEWIDLFDGHGLAIYPKTMTTRDVDKIARAVWKRGLDQVSVVQDPIRMGIYRPVFIIPKNYSFEKEFGNMNADEAVSRKHQSQTSDYFGKGIHISSPKYFYSNDWQLVTDVINAPDELILVTRLNQNSYQWVTGEDNWEIEVDGVRHRQTRAEGMEGFETTYFWSPDFGYFYKTFHFPPVPASAKTVNVYGGNSDTFIRKLQITEDDLIFDGVTTYEYIGNGLNYTLQTTHVNDNNAKDEFFVRRVDFTDKETTVYCSLLVRAPHSYPGYVSSDFRLQLGDGKTIRPLRIEGVPLDQDYDRHGDWVHNYFQVIFPAISQDDWKLSDPILHGSVMHEPFSLIMNSALKIPEFRYEPLSDFKGKGYLVVSSIEASGTHLLMVGTANSAISLPENVTVSRNGSSEYIIKGEFSDDKQKKVEYRIVISDATAQIADVEAYGETSASLVKITDGDGKVTNAYGISVYEDDRLSYIILKPEGSASDIRLYSNF